MRVDSDFDDEYPDADATCTETHATLCRAGDALYAQLERRVNLTLGVNQTVATTLAVLDGAGEPLTPSQISERLLIASATMTSTLDTLERRGWICRTPNPEDRRSLLIEITEEGRRTADQFLPGIHNFNRRVMSALTEAERVQLLGLLDKVFARLAEIAEEPLEPLSGRRVRPARLR